jgi:uncharacterized protein YdeI (YjbR/CyaY-like superfamily)
MAKTTINNDETLYSETRAEWRAWLQKNHRSRERVWLVYFKKHTRKLTVSYADAVEEAICFGWIDGQIRRIDADRYMQRFTPRRARSRWSEINVERAEKMIEQGWMTECGLKTYVDGTKTDERVPSSKSFAVPQYLKEAIEENRIAWDNFQRFSPSAQLAYVYWVSSAKKEETRQRRIRKTIARLASNKKYGDE